MISTQVSMKNTITILSFYFIGYDILSTQKEKSSVKNNIMYNIYSFFNINIIGTRFDWGHSRVHFHSIVLSVLLQPSFAMFTGMRCKLSTPFIRNFPIDYYR